MTTAPGPTVGTLAIVFGGCAGMWSDLPPVEPGQEGCRDRSGPRGSTVYYGWRSETGAVYASALGEPDMIMFTDEMIADLIADPAFVA